ncbi:LuxR C-terminal-related transcriptional regulator [Kitasatospora sp. NPDC051164]|uniref:helix-turn-helix transcriptional regulator n=1 Tax=Kitasatospora sp. NPDC051164 TaxID=3364055 RepID=UPI00379EDF33
MSHLLDSLRETAVLTLEKTDLLSRELTRENTRNSSQDGLPTHWGEEISGLSNIASAINSEVNSARREMLTAQPDGRRPPETLKEALASVEKPIRAGVKMRTLYQHTARFDEATKEYVRAVSDLGVEVRTLGEFFDRLLIFDGRVAFVPSSPNRSRALRITHPALVAFLVDSFDRAWDRASGYPFVPNHSAQAALEVLPDLRSSIKRLLVRGYSDAAIARRLGISSRSLQAHIQRIKQDLGAANRLQLGYILAREDYTTSDLSPDGVTDQTWSALPE